jgi:hypothetical protein
MSRLILRLGSSLSSMVSSQIIPKRNAGHSKWANIRHTKAAKDGEKSELFRKLSRQIRLAIVGTLNVWPFDCAILTYENICRGWQRRPGKKFKAEKCHGNCQENEYAVRECSANTQSL